jgi:hypothetical protein
MSLAEHLISQLHDSTVTDTAGIIYDSGGPANEYSDNEDYVVRLIPADTNSAIAYLFSITYDIGEGDSLIFYNSLTFEKQYVFTDGQGEETIYHLGRNVEIRFVSNENSTRPGFAISFYHIYEIGPQGLPPSVIGPWYYRPDDYSVASGFHLAPNENRPMGNSSLAFGYTAEATANHSIAMGPGTRASGVASFSLGVFSLTTGYASTAMGIGSSAHGDYSHSAGLYTTTSGPASMAVNAYTNASGHYSFAQGYNTKAEGPYTASFGAGTRATGFGSMATGLVSLASGNGSISMGDNTIANSYLSLVAGRNNDTTAASSNMWINTDPLFVVGNGVSIFNRSNALTLFKNGDMTIAGTLTQNSDARLKQNIERLDDVMDKLQQINGYRYQWNTPYADQHEKKIGLLAQEIEQVIPELVRRDGNGVMSVDYSGLIPFLLEAIKMQQQEIEILKSRL